MTFFDILQSLDLPRFRKEQLLKAWFDPKITSFHEITTLPKNLRQNLAQMTAWSSFTIEKILSSKTTFKALINLQDSKKIETVLMINAKGNWTACLSSQVGCAMGCDFCATGTMGFFRDLSTDEIVDQMRFWRTFLIEKKLSGTLSNVVMMGMGEPLNNYEATRDAMRYFVEYFGIGKTKITLSTVGVKNGMNKILEDPLWPDVRIAISLHYPVQEKRKIHMPVARQHSLDELKLWCQKYLQKYGNRKHHLTFEYLVFEAKNDTNEDIAALKNFLKGIDRYKMNLIPWNPVYPLPYTRATREKTENFQKRLMSSGIKSTIRKSLGVEIDAGCGQLAVLEEEPASAGSEDTVIKGSSPHRENV